MSLDFVTHNRATLFTFNGIILISAPLPPNFSIILHVDSFCLLLRGTKKIYLANNQAQAFL